MSLSDLGSAGAAIAGGAALGVSAVAGVVGAVGGGLSGIGADLLRMKLISTANPLEFVIFSYNPTAIKVVRKQKPNMQQGTTRQPSSGGGAAGAVASAAGGGGGTTAAPRFGGTYPTQITCTKAILDGPMTKTFAETILSWQTSGVSTLLGLVGGLLGMANLTSEPPVLILQYGPPGAGLFYQCQMLSSDVSYVRFDRLGIPNRAEVNFTVVEKPSLLGTILTNPTSGGIPGRQKHLLTEGENLQALATKAYGGPSPWREVADANGIDDPFRVKPGKSVYLPSPRELTERGR